MTLNKLHLKSINPGSFSNDKGIYQRLITYNNGFIELNDNYVTITSKDNSTFRSDLRKTEKNFTSATYIGKYEDGKSFRLIRPDGEARILMLKLQKPERICFASMTGDGYAVHFDLVNKSEPDNFEHEQAQNEMSTSVTESKAETLVMTASRFKDMLPDIAKEYLGRFMNLLDHSKVEIIKFDYIQNILYGYSLAVLFSLLDEQSANQKLNNMKLRFFSSDHLRYENGIHVSGPHGGAARVVEIVPNFQKKEGYIVTIFNQDNNHPFFGNNVQMSPKQMRVINKTPSEIKLRGFGKDNFGSSYQDYGITICFSGLEIDHIKLHLLDKGVVIKYIS